MDPDFNQPQQPPSNLQGGYGPTLPNPSTPGVQPPAGVQPSKAGGGGGGGSSKKMLVIIGVVLAVVILIFVAVAIFMSDPEPEPDPAETPQTEAKGPQPADAVSTEQANNAISQAISNHNDDEEFPANQLSDEELEL